MEYNNDERYWNINLLNKWFAISSILFLLSFVWMFYFDNDDEFKTYQREFRKLEVEVSEKKLEEALIQAQKERSEYENKYNSELELYNSKTLKIDSLHSDLNIIDGLFYKANMDFLFQKAEVDGLKYLYEDEIVHSSHQDGDSHQTHHYEYKDKYLVELDKMNELKLLKEDYELKKSEIESKLKDLRADLKLKVLFCTY